MNRGGGTRVAQPRRTSPRTWSTNRRDQYPMQRQVYDLSLTVPLWGRTRIVPSNRCYAKPIANWRDRWIYGRRVVISKFFVRSSMVCRTLPMTRTPFMFKNLILFYRRLIVLAVVCLALLFVLAVQLGRLTLEQGQSRFEKAHSRLHLTTFLPTWRGRITDRHGRILAEDVASYAIAIDWDVITGDRALQYAREDAKDSVGRDRWKSISPEERQYYVDAYLPGRQSELQDFWKMVSEVGGVSLDDVGKNLKLIRKEVEHTAKVVWVRQEEMHRKRFGEDVPFVKRPIREQREPHVVLPRVEDEVAIAFEMLSEQYDGVIHVEHARQRDYQNRIQNVLVDRSTLPRPMRQDNAIKVQLDHVAELIVGDVRHEVWAEDIDKSPFRLKGKVNLSGYRAGDEVGKMGLEKSLEDTLRGVRGKVVRHRSGEELSRTSVEGGKNVQVTLDIKLQARVEAALSPELGLMSVQDWHRHKAFPIGTHLRGAVVVLDIDTSEVLAMASTPALRDEQDVEGYPWLNRATDGLYPPGSIIKPLVLTAAITEGKIKLSESIECVGHFFENVTDFARCWIYRPNNNIKTHGHLKSVEAIARSCNIFFYELGTRLGFETLLSWLQKFGMSKPLSDGLTNEKASGTQGYVPSKEDIQALRERGALAFETVSISIGQGALAWSPLHAAAAFATLARGGLWIPPKLDKGIDMSVQDLELNQEGVELAMLGLRDSVTKKYGTGSRLRYGANNDEPIFNIDGVRIWGKTGTAQAPPYKLNGSSKKITGLVHAWYLVMASEVGAAKPTVVVAVLVEHGGSGGRVAGPIANQILHALQAEGYLEQTR